MRSWRDSGRAQVARQVQGNIDNHVLLSVNHMSLADFEKECSRIDPTFGCCLFGRTQKRGMQSRVAQRQGLAIDPNRPVLQGPDELLGRVHQRE